MGESLNVERIRDFLVRQWPMAHPIQHPMGELDEYVKNRYADMLCVFAQYENRGTEAAANFIQRLMAGAGMSEPVTEHIKNAMELTVEGFDEFLTLCRENDLSDGLLLDGMLIACAGGPPGKKQLEFLAELAEILMVEKSRLKYLSQMARAILEQDQEGYYALCQELPECFRMALIERAVPYLKEFISGILVDTPEMLWLYAREKSNFDLSDFSKLNISHDTVLLEHLTVKSADLYTINFAGSCQKIELRECSFRNCRLQFFNVSKLTINNCEFTASDSIPVGFVIRVPSWRCENFYMNGCYMHDIYLGRGSGRGDRTALISVGKENKNCEFKASDSSFENIKLPPSAHTSSLFFCVEPSKARLSKCRFAKCNVNNTNPIFSGDWIIEKDQNCEFQDCWPLKG